MLWEFLFFYKNFEKDIDKNTYYQYNNNKLINKMILTKKAGGIMEKQKVLAVYGGSFNPILNSHLTIAKSVLNEFEEVDKVVFVPVSNKYEKLNLVENKYRYEMIKLAISTNENLLVSDIEMKSKEQLRTIQTLNILKEQYKEYEIWFIMGTDNLKEFNTWMLPEELLKNFKIIVIERDADKLEDIICANSLLQKYKGNIKKINCKIQSNMSSTFVRNKIKNGESVAGLLPKSVEEYIKKNQLYK